MDHDFGKVLENISKLKKRKENFIVLIKKETGLVLNEKDFSFLQSRIFLNIPPNQKFLIKQKELKILKELRDSFSEKVERII